MCYQVILSTSSDEDLSVHDCDLVKFSRDLPIEKRLEELQFPNKWHVQSQSICSCTFRHIMGPDLGFGEPVDWYPEEALELAATELFISIVRGLLEGNYNVDCLDVWEHDEMSPAESGVKEVNLSIIKNTEFRFFENYYFNFKVT